jgi:hypothetical protein
VSAWHEIALHGSDEAARTFVAGFLAGRGERPQSVLFDDDLDLEPESLGERVRDLLLAGSHVVLVCPESVAVPLAEALADPGLDVRLRLERCRLITSASFSFRSEAFSEKVADDIRRTLLATLPTDVATQDVSERVERHPEAHGVELYAPMHPYVCRTSGRIVGGLTGVLEMHRRARALDFVEAGRLHLEGRLLSGRE